MQMGFCPKEKKQEEQGMCNAALMTEEILRCRQFISVFL